MKWLLPPVLFLLCLFAMFTAAWYVPESIFPAPYNWWGALLILAGLAFGATGAATFREKRTNLNPLRNPTVLVTGGVFSLSRNPMYLGLAVCLLGVALILDTAPAFFFVVLFFLVANYWYVPFEEMRMRESFGATYEAYCARTRRWI